MVFWKVYTMMHGQKNIKLYTNKLHCVGKMFSFWTNGYPGLVAAVL